ncbi:MAG TPA: hypothetical protein VGK33_19395 [Chloroflexota bacterium]
MRRYRAVAQEDDWGGGVACVASVLGASYAQIVAKLGEKWNRKPAPGLGPPVESLRRVLNDGFKDTGLVYELDGPFIGDPNSLETGSIVSLVSGRYLMRAAEGWMDPARGKMRKRLPDKVRMTLILTPDNE